MKSSIFIALIFSAAFPGPSLAYCPNVGQGGQLTYVGGVVTVRELPADAGFTSLLQLYSPVGTFPLMYNYPRNQIFGLGAYPYTVTFNPSSYGIVPGPIVFGIYVTNTGYTFYMGNGTNPLNPDFMSHAIVTAQSDGSFNVGFEDLLFGGDCDFNDNLFNFAGGITIGNPPTNAAPVVSVSAPTDASLWSVGNVSLVAPFTDANTSDTHTCTVDWDDGYGPVSGIMTQGSGSGTCSLTKTITESGVYNIVVEVRDNKGAVGTSKVMIVVYDPNAGFVTGGGWINSPIGAYQGDLATFGRASFGFVSRYLKGANVPTGQTEFQFQAGKFNFHSEAYQWLVVSGCKAQYKGTGSVNGATGFGFMLTATDGNACASKTSDKFRIKVWSLNDNSIVYDNNLGSTDDLGASNPQEISAGSIVIHK